MGAPERRSASARPELELRPPPAARAWSERVMVSGLYWKTMTLARGLKMSMPTMAPFTRRGDPGNVLMGRGLPAARHAATTPPSPAAAGPGPDALAVHGIVRTRGGPP